MIELVVGAAILLGVGWCAGGWIVFINLSSFGPRQWWRYANVWEWFMMAGGALGTLYLFGVLAYGLGQSIVG